MSVHCLNKLFTEASLEIRTTAFRMQNMLYMLQAVQEVSQNYNGVDTNRARKYFLFIRIGHHNRFYNTNPLVYNTNLLDWQDGENKRRVDSASHQAVLAFTSNSHFLNVSNEHGLVLREVFLLIRSLEIASYLPAFKRHLAQFSMEYVNHHYMLVSINIILETIYESSWQKSFAPTVSEDTELVTILTHLSLSDEYLETPADFIVENAAEELARLIRYDTATIYSFVVSGIGSIFNKYTPTGKGASIYISALRSVLYYEKCDLFSVCEIKNELQNQVLSIRHECAEVPVVILAQDLSDEQLTSTCESLLLTDSHFHEKLKTHKIPVQDDFNNKVEAVVFINWDNYNMYSGLFFGNPTNNGGIYEEGDPSDMNNTAHLIVYTTDWRNGNLNPAWTLQHEYVHYLDGRFIKYGTPQDYEDYGIFLAVWSEGLAEYIPQQNNNALARWFYRKNSENPLNLSEILQATHNSTYSISNIIYRWSYFVLRFLFENHPHEINRFKSYFINGQYDEYVSYIKNNISTYDDEFKDLVVDHFFST